MSGIDGAGDVDPRAADEHAGELAALDARLVPAAVCCWAATIVALAAGWVAGLLLAAGLMVAAIGLWVLLLWAMAHRSERLRAVALVALAAVLLGAGFAVAAAWREYRVATHPLRAVAGRSMQVVVTPSADPKAVRSNAFGEQRWVVRATLREYRSGAQSTTVGGAVVILASGEEWAALLPGRPVTFRARAEPPRRHDLTVATLRAQGPPEPAGAPPWWQRVAGYVRAELSAAAAGALDPDAAGLLPAVVVGDTSRLPEHVTEDFEIAGLEHIYVVSGANFSILLSAVLCVVRMLTLGPRAQAAVATLTLLLFVVIARPDPSVLRAAGMGAVTLLAMVTGRRKQALPALCAAIIGLLALAPELAMRAGFALSALATAGLILLAPSWSDWLRARGWWRGPAESVAVAVAAFVVTTPLLIALSGKLSTVSILANILVEPVIGPITVLGVLAAVLSVVWPPLAEAVLLCARPLLWWLLSVAERLAAVPGAELAIPGGTSGGILACLLLVVAVLALRSRRVRRLAAVIAICLAAVLVPVRVWHPGWPPPGWVLAACDVGQGDGLALSLGGGAAIVVDVGPQPRLIRSCLDRLRITTIPLLLLSHPHADHIGGLAGALRGRTVAAIAVAEGEVAASHSPPANGTAAQHHSSKTSFEREPVADIAEVVAAARAADIPLLELQSGAELNFGPVELTILAPISSGAAQSSVDNANDRSIVFAAKTPAGRILFTGDIEVEAQRALVNSGAPVQADILKVPHHGSRTTATEFLDAVHPRLAVVSVGADNTFGHPNPAILAHLSALGATVVRTDHQGDVLILGSGPTLRTVARQRNSGD
ncbi:MULTISPECIES: ComEC/Rec2 family competence protein [unclassified Nocardia]|uniref:ComEC/Rec2 family competence protein n=1 Tax=unclassified Nocardia TaxID=2637762 RepID=UPI001CE3E9D8|nr:MULTISPECIES: ComEC/Rec2 family competence protein [unclassified Nocardia]